MRPWAQMVDLEQALGCSAANKRVVCHPHLVLASHLVAPPLKVATIQVCI